MDMLGKLSFRYSYSQNVLAHSIEVSLLAGLLAAELGMNIAQARRAGLLHDIGKAMSHENEGCHAQIGADFLQNNSESPAVVSAVANHHSHQMLIHDPYSPLTCLISAADAISAARPGARLEAMQSFIKRFEQLNILVIQFLQFRNVLPFKLRVSFVFLLNLRSLQTNSVNSSLSLSQPKCRTSFNFPGKYVYR